MNNATLRKNNEILSSNIFKNFSTENIEITDKALHKRILSDTDGIGSANSKRIYKSFIRWTLSRYGVKKPWPNNWIDLSVVDLSNKFI